MSIAERYLQVRDTVAGVCRTAGRNPDGVRLIAVTKYVETERIAEAVAAGCRQAGENHAQEVREKLTFYKNNGITLHFIGQLQTNKIKYICGNAEYIHSVDRLSLLQALDAFAKKLGVRQNILLQVNIGREPQKGGVLPEALFALTEAALGCANLSLQGLMCVPPESEPDKAGEYFAALRELRDRLRTEFLTASSPQDLLSELSMGMSRDYPEAIREGATMVRVGSAIFGARGRL